MSYLNDNEDKRVNGLTVRDALFMAAACRYGPMDREHFEVLCLPETEAKSRARVARRRIASLVKRGLLAREGPPGAIDAKQLTRLTVAGREWSEATFCDPVINGKPTTIAQPYHTQHTLDCVDTHILMRRAVKALGDAKLCRWILEGETVNYWEGDSKKQHDLRITLQERPKLVVAPDGAGHFKLFGLDAIYLLEEDRCTSSAERVAKIKSKGVAELAASERHREFFPGCEAKGFLTLLITTKPSRRDRLCDALAACKTSPELWRVASKPDLNEANFFTEPVWRTHDHQPVPLIPRSLIPSPVSQEPNNGRSSVARGVPVNA